MTPAATDAAMGVATGDAAQQQAERVEGLSVGIADGAGSLS
jgi:hypothetical protein